MSKLFSENLLSRKLSNMLIKTEEEIRNLSPRDFDNKTLDNLTEELFNKSQISPIEIDSNKINISEIQDFHDSSGHFVKFSINIPYTGDQDLWFYRPNQYIYTVITGNVVRYPRNDAPGLLTIEKTIQFSAFSQERVDETVEKTIDVILQFLSFSEADINKHNKKLHDMLEQKIPRRKSEIDRINNAARNSKYSSDSK